ASGCGCRHRTHQAHHRPAQPASGQRPRRQGLLQPARPLTAAEVACFGSALSGYGTPHSAQSAAFWPCRNPPSVACPKVSLWKQTQTASSNSSISSRTSPTRSPPSERTLSSMRPPCSCSGWGGRRFPHGPGRCGACCPKNSPVRRRRTRTLSSTRWARVADRPRRTLTVRDAMTTRVVVTSPDDPVADAAAAMVRQRVGSALIVQGRFLAGILTERDVLRAAASGSDLTNSPVSAWMTRDPEQVSPDTTVEDALQLML